MLLLGPLVGSVYPGGSYGGLGGSATNKGYGDLTAPSLPGSGGYNKGGAGGAALNVQATTIEVNGRISAEGGLGTTGGSGGAIWLYAANLFVGAGNISVCGGMATSGGSGGGGRISVVAPNSAMWTGTIYASTNYPGTGYRNTPSYWGSAGTIFTKLGSPSSISVSNNGFKSPFVTFFDWSSVASLKSGVSFDELNVAGYAQADLGYTNNSQTFLFTVTQLSSSDQTGLVHVGLTGYMGLEVTGSVQGCAVKVYPSGSLTFDAGVTSNSDFTTLLSGQSCIDMYLV